MLITLLLLGLTVGVAAAQPRPDSSDAEDGSWYAFPTVFYTPETSLGLGAAGGVFFSSGHTDRPSSLQGDVSATITGQYALNLRPEWYRQGGRQRLFGDIALSTYPDVFYGLGPDAPIARWLGERPWFDELPNREGITLRHLLTHRSGLPDHVHLEAFAEAVSRRWQEPGPPFPPDTLVQFVTGRPALFAPGEGWAYSDTGYILVGLILEAATGRDYYALVQERFLTPLGLNHTRPSNHRILPGLAAGYTAATPFGWPEKSTTEDGVLAWHPGLEWTGGGLVSTSADLARWGAALFGGTALPEAALDQMLDAQPVDPAQPDVGYGMGVAVYQSGPFGPVYGHGGWIPGYVSSLRYYADHGVAIALQINTDAGLETDTTSVVQEMESRLAEVVLSENQTDESARTTVQGADGG